MIVRIAKLWPFKYLQNTRPSQTPTNTPGILYLSSCLRNWAYSINFLAAFPSSLAVLASECTYWPWLHASLSSCESTLLHYEARTGADTIWSCDLSNASCSSRVRVASIFGLPSLSLILRTAASWAKFKANWIYSFHKLGSYIKSVPVPVVQK